MRANSSRRGVQALLSMFMETGGQLVVMLSSFLLTPLVLSFTSKSLFGSWQAALSILSYLAMLDAGLGFSLIRLVASASEKRGIDGLSAVATTSLCSFSAVAAALCAAGFYIAPYVPAWFHVPQHEAYSVVLAYRLATLAAAVALPFAAFGGVLVGLQKLTLAAVIRVVGAILGALLSLVLLYCHLGIAALALANLIGSLVGGALALTAVFRCLPGLRIHPRLVTGTELKALWNVAGYFQLVRIAYIIALNTDALIIAKFLGAAEVTPYVITTRMASLFSTVLADKAPSAAYPALAQMYAAGEAESLRRGYLALVYYSTRLALVGASLVALLNPQFVVLWVGPQGFGGASLNYILVYSVLIDTILRGISIIPLTTGDMRAWAIASLFEALLNMGSSLLLMHWFGIVGAALGTAVARTLVTGLFIPRWSCKKIVMSLKDFAWSGIASPALRCLPGIFLTIALAYSLPHSLGWFRLFLVGGVTVIANLAAFEGVRWLRQPDRNFQTLLTEILTPAFRPSLVKSATAE